MASSSGIGGLGSNPFEHQEDVGHQEEQPVPAQAEATTSTDRSAREQADTRFAAFEEPPAYGMQDDDQLLDRNRQRPFQAPQRQASLPPPGPAAPEYSGSATAPSRPPTSRIRRMQSALSLRSQASSSSLRTQAGASRTSLPGLNPAGEALPPVPPLPPGLRQRQATQDSAASGRSEPQGPATAGPSEPRGPANLTVAEETPAKRGILSRRTPQDVQDDRNHKLRESVTTGDTKGITRRLGKGADPTTPSAINRQNAFHKLASTSKFNRDTTQELIDASDPARLGQAAIAKDINGNTPIHIAQHNLGKAETNNNEAMQRRYRDLRDKLTQAATENGHNVNSITNNEGRTPQQMRQTGRQVAENAIEADQRLRGDLGNAELI
jgi:hypothetical protein